MRVSLKYKLLFLLILLPSVALFSYMQMAKDLFEKDKIAYVFTTGLAQVEGLSNRIEERFDFFDFINSQFIQSYNANAKKVIPSTERLITGAQNILNYQVYYTEQFEQGEDPLLRENIVGDPERLESLKLTNFTSDDVFEKLFFKQRVLRIVDYENGVLSFFTKIKEEGTGGFFITNIVFQDAELIKQFIKKDLFYSFLVDSNGKILLGRSSVGGKKIANFQDWSFFKKTSSTKASIGTFETQGPTNTKYLLSYSKLLGGDYSIVTFLEKDIALRATEILVANSWLFLIAALSLSLIFSIFGANKLTASLRKIYAASLKVAKGDFNINVKIKSRDEVGQLANSFNSMASEISTLLGQLKEYNEKLELMVQERTAELNEALQMQKAMVDSLGQGFFIFDNRGLVLPVYSKASTTMFGKEPSGENVGDLMHLSDSEKESFKGFIPQLFDEPIPFHDLVGMCPQSFQNQEQRHIDLEYHPVRDDNEKILGIVVVGTDKTDEKAALAQAEKEKAYVQMIVKILSNKMQFFNFISEAKELIADMKSSLDSDLSLEKKQESLFRYMHTMKGNAALFHLIDVQQHAHRCEDELSSIADAPEEEKVQKLQSIAPKIEELESKFAQFIQENSKIIGMKSWDKFEKNLSIGLEKIKSTYQTMIQTGAPKRAIEEFVENIYAQPASTFLGHYQGLVDQVAQDLGKKMAPIEFHGEQTPIIGEMFSELFSSLVHAFRNAVDHGIESPDERAELGKPEQGSLDVTVEKARYGVIDFLQIRIKDDGKGINPSVIREKVVEKGILTQQEEQKKSDQEIIQYIFHPGFSTQANVSDISGRGVGMDAIKNVARDLGGTVEVESEVGKGTLLTVQVPLKEYQIPA